ncbi:hypothetical protein EXIGLDRAFT_302425 [Exidia glandulosa HHB12029]|uniref:Uncharacterized protein n=1 Tax=Exidia glandulosa HHB12029 TaxID=1314781 RepID=A0A165ZLY5_EXIGL|nr:hypothetical protein EXIGLDRAFT_302425 [Exidia glandulosa HHB12029]
MLPITRAALPSPTKQIDVLAPAAQLDLHTLLRCSFPSFLVPSFRARLLRPSPLPPLTLVFPSPSSSSLMNLAKPRVPSFSRRGLQPERVRVRARGPSRTDVALTMRSFFSPCTHHLHTHRAPYSFSPPPHVPDDFHRRPNLPRVIPTAPARKPTTVDPRIYPFRLAATDRPSALNVK